MLNIRNPEVQALAKEIAERRGVSVTDAVRDALRDTICRIRRERDVHREGRYERMMELARQFKEAAGPAFPGRPEIDADLYDDDGLPR